MTLSTQYHWSLLLIPTTWSALITLEQVLAAELVEAGEVLSSSHVHLALRLLTAMANRALSTHEEEEEQEDEEDEEDEEYEEEDDNDEEENEEEDDDDDDDDDDDEEDDDDDEEEDDDMADCAADWVRFEEFYRVATSLARVCMEVKDNGPLLKTVFCSVSSPISVTNQPSIIGKSL